MSKSVGELIAENKILKRKLDDLRSDRVPLGFSVNREGIHSGTARVLQCRLNSTEFDKEQPDFGFRMKLESKFGGDWSPTIMKRVGKTYTLKAQKHENWDLLAIGITGEVWATWELVCRDKSRMSDNERHTWGMGKMGLVSGNVYVFRSEILEFFKILIRTDNKSPGGDPICVSQSCLMRQSEDSLQ